MQKTDFQGVFPAITTKMTDDQEIDLAALRADVAFQIEAGVDAIIVCGSLGEASTLTAQEKIVVLEAAVAEAAGRLPIVLTIAEDSTRAAMALAKAGAKAGAQGLMVLPAMRYLSDSRETMAHFRAVAAASDLPIILYNNPVAYTVELTTGDLVALADEPKFVAIKDSTADTRRINEAIAALGDRYQIMTGVDDLALESLMLGCVGWIAGLVVAFPRETVAIYTLAKAGRIAEALEIYRWFLPLLHLDIGPKFVQQIKLCEAIVRGTNPTTRAPRLALAGVEEAKVRAVVEKALASRPNLSKYGV